jgi:hypothetical protein
MVDDLPNPRLAVYIFLEMIALGFALEAVAAFMRGDAAWKWVGALVLGVVFMVLGVKSEQIVKRSSQYLNSRLVWMATVWVAFLGSLYFLQQSIRPMAAMNLHQRLNGPLGYVVVGAAGALLSCACWWFIGRLAPVSAPKSFTITDPKEREELLRAIKNIYQAKAAYLENPLVHKAREARQDLRKKTEEIETKVGCLIDSATVECLPKPPKVIDKMQLEMSISAMVIAEELYKSHFWIVRKKEGSKFRVPVVIFLSMTNRHEEAINVKLLYLESRSAGKKWADVRMADSLSPAMPPLTMETTPLVRETDNKCVVMNGDYLLPSLYNRLLKPGESASGWIVAELPKGVQYGDLIGEMRVSVMDAKEEWVSSKTFSTDPPIYPTDDAGVLVQGSIITPFDFFIDED